MIQLLGWTSTILFTVCFIPQIIKMARTKKVNDMSFAYFAIQVIANVTALCYALLIAQTPLVVKYISAIIMLIIVLWFYFKYNS